MSDANEKNRSGSERVIEYEDLNALGRAVLLGGVAVRGAAKLIDVALDRAATIVAESERAFRQGRDPNIEDAKVIEEREERRR